MSFLCLFSLVRSDYFTITPENAKRFIGGPKPLVVKFFKDQSGDCMDIAPEFSRISTLYSDVVFGGIQCDDYPDLCQEHNAQDMPTILLFKPKSQHGYQFNGNLAEDNAIIKFIQRQLGKNPSPAPNTNLIELNSFNYQRFMSSSPCGLVLLTGRRCHPCLHLVPQFTHLSGVYLRETNISIGITKCENDPQFCESQFYVHDVEINSRDETRFESMAEGNIFPPVVKFLKNGRWANYSGNFEMTDWVALINRECGAERRTDGLVNELAGTSAAGDDILRRFLATSDQEGRKKLIEEAKGVAEGDVYVMAMERYLEKGEAQMRKDLQAMRESLHERKSSIASRDALKKRFNVFVKLVRRVRKAVPPPADDYYGDEM
jgi:thiol-disulfide isomerase/thioredoxin